VRLNHSGPNGESRFFEKILKEAVHVFGDDFQYIVVQQKAADMVFGEYLKLIMSTAIDMILFQEEKDNWGGSGIVFSSIGASITDAMTLYGAKSYFEGLNVTPKIGDLIFFPKTKRLFEVQFIEDESPFYPLGDSVCWFLKCELYAHNKTKANMKTNIQSVDQLATAVNLGDIVNNRVTQQVDDKSVLDTSEVDNNV